MWLNHTALAEHAQDSLGLNTSTTALGLWPSGTVFAQHTREPKSNPYLAWQTLNKWGGPVRWIYYHGGTNTLSSRSTCLHTYWVPGQSRLYRDLHPKKGEWKLGGIHNIWYNYDPSPFQNFHNKMYLVKMWMCTEPNNKDEESSSTLS